MQLRLAFSMQLSTTNKAVGGGRVEACLQIERVAWLLEGHMHGLEGGSPGVIHHRVAVAGSLLGMMRAKIWLPGAPSKTGCRGKAVWTGLKVS